MRMHMHTASGRSRWPWIIAGILIAAAIIAVVIFAATRGATTAGPSMSPSASSSTPTASPTETSAPPSDGGEDLGAAPTGCLGGPNRDVAMVLAAQEAAPHTMYGAIDVATAYTRWGLRYPFPSAADAVLISDALVAKEAPSDVQDIAGGYVEGADITGGQVPVGTIFSWSTVGGLWLVSADSTADRVTVSINGSYVIDGALSPTATGAIALEMVWEDSAWHINGAERPDVAAIAAGGTTFTNGC